MKMKALGRTGLKVSELCFGAMSFGKEADAETSAAMFRACRERGINFFDTADQYTDGRSEEILGALIREERDNLIIATKCFNKVSPDVNAGGGNRRHVTRAVENSLKRLGTDRVELLYMHRWDSETPVEEVLRGLEDVVRAGKVLHIGASNWAAWQVSKALGISERRGWTRFDAIQPMYNLVKRQAEVEILPMAEAEGLAVMTYSPVGGGLLSGKYQGGGGEGRLKVDEKYAARYGEGWAHETAVAFSAKAAELGAHPVSLAVAWVGSNPGVTAPIIGARSVEQLQASLAAVDVPMTPALRAELSALSRTPPLATDRLEEA